VLWGVVTGGVSNGGAVTGGVSTGGVVAGGVSTGGVSTGGAPTGVSTGGVSTGGALTGGVSAGLAPTGVSTGGVSTGGALKTPAETVAMATVIANSKKAVRIAFLFISFFTPCKFYLQYGVLINHTISLFNTKTKKHRSNKSLVSNPEIFLHWVGLKLHSPKQKVGFF
jgi:uncharacterized protein with PQ loop repeat